MRRYIFEVAVVLVLLVSGRTVVLAVEDDSGFKVPRDMEKMDPREKQKLGYEAHKEFSKINEFLRKGGDREEARKRYLEFADKYQGLELADEAAELSGFLNAMAIEDRKFKEPEDVENLSEEEKIEYYVFKLRDVSERAPEIPGSVNVLMRAEKDSPARKLRMMGKAGMPQLVSLLEDRRPTRSCEEAMNGHHVLRYCDASLQIIEAIACHAFLTERGRGIQLANSKPGAREKTIEAVRGWWEKNKDKSEAEWLRDSIAGDEISRGWRRTQGMKRLVEIEGKESVDFFRDFMEREPQNSAILDRLWEAGGDEVLKDIRERTGSPTLRIRCKAYRILVGAGENEHLDLVMRDLELGEDYRGDREYPFGSLAWTLIVSDVEGAVIRAAELLKSENERTAHRAAMVFLSALEKRDKPRKELRGKVMPYMGSALNGKNSRYWAARWIEKAAELEIDIDGKDTPEERKKEIQKVEAWWEEHKDEYE